MAGIMLAEQQACLDKSSAVLAARKQGFNMVLTKSTGLYLMVPASCWHNDEPARFVLRWESAASQLAAIRPSPPEKGSGVPICDTARQKRDTAQ
jgi:hypothetical protein